MPNDFFSASGAPGTNAFGASAPIRDQLAAIATAFDKMPGLTANGNKVVTINAGGTALAVSAALLTIAGALTGLTGLTMASGQAAFSPGSVSAPGVAFAGNLNTGLWSPSADTVAVSTGGAERFSINSLGAITIQPPSGVTQLTATSAVPGVAQFNVVNSSSLHAGAAYQASNDVGNVSALLMLGSAAATYGGRLANEANLYSNRSINIMADNASGGIKFQTGGNTTRAQISSTGQFGVGLAPSANFQVQLLNETGGGSNQGFSLVGAGSTRQFNFGINSTSGAPWIQGWIPGTGASDIAINPQGGATAFGGALSYSFVNTTVTQRQLTSINASATGQSGIGFTINGTERGALRVDYVGNTNYVSNGGDHYWYTGGDAGVGTNRLVLTADGRLYGASLHNNAGSMTGTATQYVGSGTRTGVSTTGTANIVGTGTNTNQWIRVGNVVTVSGVASVTINALGVATGFRCDLPIASVLGTGNAVVGLGLQNTAVALVSSDSVNNQASITWTAVNTGSQLVFYHYTYEIKA